MKGLWLKTLTSIESILGVNLNSNEKIFDIQSPQSRGNWTPREECKAYKPDTTFYARLCLHRQLIREDFIFPTSMDKRHERALAEDSYSN